MKKELFAIVEEFDVPERVVDIAPLKRGHINDTYVALCDGSIGNRKFILQRVNHDVFPNVPRLMDNIVRLTSHIRKSIASNSTGERDETLEVIPTKRGGSFLEPSPDEYWRMYVFIDNCEAFDQCVDAAQAREAARTAARFQRHVMDLSPKDFYETIPRFHDTPNRFEILDKAIQKDSAKRAKMAQPEIQFALERKELAGLIVNALACGVIPSRVTHNDLKINNILFARNGGKGIAIVDLDTCMAGSPLYDFGDLLRNTSVAASEDELDLSRVFMNLDYFENLVQGYLDGMKDALTAAEIELLPEAPRILALELGVRFLTDYLSGDGYFKIQHERHNLERARVQFRIVQSMEAQVVDMRKIVDGLVSG